MPNLKKRWRAIRYKCVSFLVDGGFKPPSTIFLVKKENGEQEPVS
jgi:hypothetical protein